MITFSKENLSFMFICIVILLVLIMIFQVKQVSYWEHQAIFFKGIDSFHRQTVSGVKPEEGCWGYGTTNDYKDFKCVDGEWVKNK